MLQSEVKKSCRLPPCTTFISKVKYPIKISKNLNTNMSERLHVIMSRFSTFMCSHKNHRLLERGYDPKKLRNSVLVEPGISGNLSPNSVKYH